MQKTKTLHEKSTSERHNTTHIIDSHQRPENLHAVYMLRTTYHKLERLNANSSKYQALISVEPDRCQHTG